MDPRIYKILMKHINKVENRQIFDMDYMCYNSLDDFLSKYIEFN